MYNTDMPTRAELPSARQLLRSTGIALAVAGVLLTTVVMPSEYGIDPTGLGKVLGLTAMGQIKTELAQDAATDAAKPAAAVAAAPAATTKAADGAVAIRTDETRVTLAPGGGTEVKMHMLKGAKVSYSWQTDGGVVNHDTHGEPVDGPAGVFHRYLKEKMVTGNTGEFTAEFDGNHGWFWRNRSDKDVTITLKTRGQYSTIKQMH
jgi:hypothetical protein